MATQKKYAGSGESSAAIKQECLTDTNQSNNSTKSPRIKNPNPMWKYMGLGENFHPRLPSRNWIIFLTIVGSFSATVVYDKREKKRNQLKWCKLVEHVAKQHLDPRKMPRKIAIYLEAPPQDGLRAAQDHFKEFIKPILVSSGLDWEFIQGRKEGDIREQVIDRIMHSRLSPEEKIEKDFIAQFRMKNKVTDFEGPGGDIVIGRHTWKEYIQGLHEGWIAIPKDSEDLASKSQNNNDITDSIISSETPQGDRSSSSDYKLMDSSETLVLPRPYFNTHRYFMSPLLEDIPSELEPSVPISFPHLLGFLNTPKRIYRFLNRRKLADSIGREIAAAILSSYRPYHIFEDLEPSELSTKRNSQYIDHNESSYSESFEQQVALQDEEKDWHKSVWAQQDAEPKRLWSCPLVLDPRIATRMRRYELSPEEEEKANRIEIHEEEVEGWIKGNIRSLWRAGVTALFP